MAIRDNVIISSIIELALKNCNIELAPDNIFNEQFSSNIKVEKVSEINIFSNTVPGVTALNLQFPKCIIRCSC